MLPWAGPVSRLALFATVVSLLGVTTLRAQDPGLDRLCRRIKSEELSLMVLLQDNGEYDPSHRSGSRSGFRVPNARIGLTGELASRHLSYLIQAGLVVSPSLLDLKLGYQPSQQLAVEVGQFKAPFSQEALIGAAALEFTERAAVVTALAPGRQVGAQIRLRSPSGLADFAIGGFNGNGQGRISNDDDRLLLAGRLVFHPATSERDGLRLDLAIQGGISRDSSAPLPGLVTAFAGKRRLLGADMRAEWKGWLFAAEGIQAWLDFSTGGKRRPRGWYLTGGRMLVGRLQLLTRWERLDADGLGQSESLILVGAQFRPNPVWRFRLQYGLPLSSDPLGRHRVVGGVQLNL